MQKALIETINPAESIQQITHFVAHMWGNTATRDPILRQTPTNSGGINTLHC